MAKLCSVTVFQLVLLLAVSVCSARMIESSADKANSAISAGSATGSTTFLKFVQVWPHTECLVREMADPLSSECNMPRESKKDFKVLRQCHSCKIVGRVSLPSRAC